jgi:hypothetical protein
MLKFDAIAHNATTFAVTPEKTSDKAIAATSFKPDGTPPQPSHMQDFFSCVRKRKTPKCNEDEALIETATFVMSVISYKEKRQVRFDSNKQVVV